ncbi:Alpha/Beta hydrolase protein [Pleurostoma richardsiae]|uniref:Alpha/Beta hydrolase protein n=1 Tax=Pleurostoma richardsiae TaxID=41990 RepID=A0AA38S338_9PEZI|nr:Alpha/Beta hydrolase protein [Pleurostoma richardsiae]
MPPRTRVPTQADFAPLSPALTLSLHFPSPPESTTAILILFHGLGDSEAPFAAFARGMSLPGVLAIAVRGTSPLPPSLLGDEQLSGDGTGHFHWGDDLNLAPGTGELDPDPGFDKAAGLVMDRLVRETLVGRCGWELSDILLFGFGQGGSLALGLASQARMAPRVEEVTGDGEAARDGGRAFKGVVSIGGPLPTSMIPSISARPKARTPVLLCHGAASDAVDEDAADVVKKEFADVKVVRWRKPDDSMPRSREEMLPIMHFFADRLRSGPTFSFG